MKKIFGILIASAIILSSCENGAINAKLNDEVDTLSYAMGMNPANGLKEYITTQLGIDSTNMDDVLKGIKEVINVGSSEKDKAYLQGIMLGIQLKQMFSSINQQIVGNDSIEVLKKKLFMAGFLAVAKDKKTKLSKEFVAEKLDSLMKNVQTKHMEKTYGKNKKVGEKFLADNAKKEGVITLPSGVQYKEIKAGNGEKPIDGDTVTIKYEGKTVDGNVFDSTWDREDGIEMKIGQTIPGFTEALKLMPIGSIWEVYIPQDLAYGSQITGKIEPFSTLIFKIELINIKNAE